MNDINPDKNDVICHCSETTKGQIEEHVIMASTIWTEYPKLPVLVRIGLSGHKKPREAR